MNQPKQTCVSCFDMCGTVQIHKYFAEEICTDVKYQQSTYHLVDYAHLIAKCVLLMFGVEINTRVQQKKASQLIDSEVHKLPGSVSHGFSVSPSHNPSLLNVMTVSYSYQFIYRIGISAYELLGFIFLPQVSITENDIHHCETSGIFMRLAAHGLIAGNDIYFTSQAAIDIRKNADPLIQVNVLV